jgi:hypothetical protein
VGVLLSSVVLHRNQPVGACLQANPPCKSQSEPAVAITSLPAPTPPKMNCKFRQPQKAIENLLAVRGITARSQPPGTRDIGTPLRE